MRKTLTTGILLACTTALYAGDEKPAAGDKAAGAAAFAKLKTLAGDWVQEDKTLVSRIRVVAGGSAVMETDFPGTEMEMISVYHMDGPHLVMTHYCVAGNQPRFRGKLEGSKLHLEFAGGSNINDKDMHIHTGLIEFVGPNRIRSRWTPWENGKAAEPHAFELTRAEPGQAANTSTSRCVCGTDR